MELTPALISAYRDIIFNPSKHGLEFKPMKDCFEKSDEVTAKHILHFKFMIYINKPLPKVIFYILMDELFGFGDGKDENGYLGYHLKIVET